jgi:hypothetical protein
MATEATNRDGQVFVTTSSDSNDTVGIVFTLILTPTEARELAQQLETCANAPPPPRDGDRHGDLTWWAGDWRTPDMLEHLRKTR